MDDDSPRREQSARDLPYAGFGREGYDVTEVDEFLDALDRALRQEKPTMAPYEVADQRFRTVRWRRGYSMREVDDHLDMVQGRLRDRHGGDAVAGLQGTSTTPRHFPTFWIYLVAFVIMALVIAFTISQT